MSTPRPSFFAELKRRNVYKVGAMYVVVGWLLLQGLTQILPVYEIAPWVIRLLVTVILLGLPVALLLSWLFDLTPKGLMRTADACADVGDDASSAPRSEYEFAFIALLAVLTIGLIVIAVRYRFGVPEQTEASKTVAAANPVTPVAETNNTPTDMQSIAVLPFENLSDDKANAYFAEGIHDEILTRLAKVGSLKVISRTSTAHYASRPGDLREIARQLGVANILEGSVQRAGNVVHINVQLVRAATDDHLWAESYNRKLDDIFGVEGEVAAAIAAALNAELSGTEQKALAKKPTENAVAYDAYLRGIALSTRTDESISHIQSLIKLFSQAVTADPNFAEAWIELANARLDLYVQYEHTPQQLAAVKAAVDTVLRLQPELPEAWRMLGVYRRIGLEDNDGASGIRAAGTNGLPSCRTRRRSTRAVREIGSSSPARMARCGATVMNGKPFSMRSTWSRATLRSSPTSQAPT